MEKNSVQKFDKIRNINDPEDSDLRAVIRYVVTLIGVDLDKHDELVFKLIRETIKKDFSDLTLEEVKSAFHLAISGDLDLKKEDIPHYQKFSSLYVSNILLSFKRFRLKHRNIKPIETKPVPQLTFDQARAHTEDIQKKFNAGEDMEDVNWTSIYGYLKESGAIKLTPDEVKAHQEKVTNELTIERQAIRQAGKNAIAIDLMFQWTELFYCECRKRAVLHYFLKEQF